MWYDSHKEHPTASVSKYKPPGSWIDRKQCDIAVLIFNYINPPKRVVPTCTKLPFHYSFSQIAWRVNNYDLWAEAAWWSRKREVILFWFTGCGWQASLPGSPVHFISLLQLDPSLLESSTLQVQKGKQASTGPPVLHYKKQKFTFTTFPNCHLFHHLSRLFHKDH